MDADHGRIDDARRMVVCPNCGQRQEVAAGAAACAHCGHRLSEEETAESELVGTPIPGIYYPEDVAPSLVSGGIGDPTDGTQVVHRVTTDIPGKSMVPSADDPDLLLAPGGETEDDA
jgi:hypothetical protein